MIYTKTIFPKKVINFELQSHNEVNDGDLIVIKDNLGNIFKEHIEYKRWDMEEQNYHYFTYNFRLYNVSKENISCKNLKGEKNTYNVIEIRRYDKLEEKEEIIFKK